MSELRSMVSSPATGTKVTVVGQHTGRLYRGEVCGHQFVGSFMWTDGERSDFFEDNEEGLHWARGWLQEWDSAGRALLAASKLARSA